MQTKRISQFTILSSLFGMFYSLFGALLFILTLNAHNKLIMNNTISSLFGESANSVGMFIS